MDLVGGALCQPSELLDIFVFFQFLFIRRTSALSIRLSVPRCRSTPPPKGLDQCCLLVNSPIKGTWIHMATCCQVKTALRAWVCTCRSTTLYVPLNKRNSPCRSSEMAWLHMDIASTTSTTGMLTHTAECLYTLSHHSRRHGRPSLV